MGRLAVLCTFARLQLANSKIYREGFPPARINIVGKTFAKHLCLWNAIFPVKMPPVHEVWSWSLWGQGGSSWPQVNPACPLTLPQTHFTHFSCLFGFLGCKHGWNRPNGRKLPMKRRLPDVFLTILMELDPPTILPCIVHIMRMIFTFYSVSFWPSWPKICCRKGSERQFSWY